MKLGYGLRSTFINRDNLQFARQAGVTHIVVHPTDYEYRRDELPERDVMLVPQNSTPTLADLLSL